MHQEVYAILMLQARLREMEDALDAERDGRLRVSNRKIEIVKLLQLLLTRKIVEWTCKI